MSSSYFSNFYDIWMHSSLHAPVNRLRYMTSNDQVRLLNSEVLKLFEAQSPFFIETKFATHLTIPTKSKPCNYYILHFHPKLKVKIKKKGFCSYSGSIR